MARPARREPTDGELEILNLLWDRGPTSLGDLCAALREQRDVATTTVATMLKVMLDKGLVTRKKTADGYRWSAKLSRRTAASGLVSRLIDRAFEGSAQRLVAHLVEEGSLSEKDLDAIRKLLETAKTSTRGK